MGHGLQDYAKRNRGRKMKIEFSAGRVRPLDPVQAAKLTSQCGIHVRSDMHVATHWKDYRKDGLDHHIPKAIFHVAELSRSVSKIILQKSIRQQRYRLKRDYNNGLTLEEALANKPPNVSQENWEALVKNGQIQETRNFDKRTRITEKLSSINKLQALGLILPISTKLKKTSTTMRTLVQLTSSKRPIRKERLEV